MFLIFGASFLILLSLTLVALRGLERLSSKKLIPRAKVEEYWMGEERRLHLRFKHDLEVEYNVEKKPRLTNGRTLDISKGGMRLVLDEKLPNGAIIDVKIQTPEKKIIEVEGEVIWTKESGGRDAQGKRFFHSGIKFIGIREPSGIHLAEYINCLELQNKEG